MIKEFENLTNEEQALLLKAPALVSVLASCTLNEINPARKAAAIELSHLRTYKAFPELLLYYAEVEKRFQEQFEDAAKKYFPFDVQQRDALKKELDKANHVIGKLDKDFARLLHKSLDKYARHVKHADHSVFEDFVFPFPVPGLTE